MTSPYLMPQCDGCALPDYGTGTCTVFVDPAYQHREGRRCWGRCASAQEMVGRLEAIVAHNEKAGTNSAGVAKLKREMRDWQQTAKAMESASERG